MPSYYHTTITNYFPLFSGKLAAAVGTVLNEKLYIIGGYDWHLAEYSDAVFLLQKKEKNISSKNLNSIIPMSAANNNNNNNSSMIVKSSNNSTNVSHNSTNVGHNSGNNKSNKSILKTEYKWILQESRLLQGRSSHACVSFEGKIWIAGKLKSFNLRFHARSY